MKKSCQNGGFCSSSSPQGLVAEAALPAHSHASTYSAFPALLDARHATSLSSAPQRVCAAHHSPPWLMHQPAPLCAKYCHRRLTLSSLEMPFSHRSGPHALAHTHVCKHTHAQMQLLALKAIAIQAGTPHPAVLLAPYLHSAKKERAKNLLQHEKLIMVVFSLAEWGCVNG